MLYLNFITKTSNSKQFYSLYYVDMTKPKSGYFVGFYFQYLAVHIIYNFNTFNI